VGFDESVGNRWLYESAYITQQGPICFKLDRHVTLRTFSLEELSAGNSKPAKIPIIATTTKNSIKVKPQ
jgi:hypothetical protein